MNKGLFPLLLFLLILVSCEKETMLTVDQSSLSFTDAGGSSSITLTANKPWSASSNQSWCKVSPSGGEEATGSRISITCDANTTYDARNAIVTITCAELTKQVSITQATNNGLLVSQTSYEITKAAQQLNIQVQANVKFSVEVDNGCKDWIKYNSTKSLSTSTVVLDIAENKSYDAREGKVTIKQDGGNLSELITVKQGPTDYLSISPKRDSISFNGGNISLSVTTNMDHSLYVEDSYPWITISGCADKGTKDGLTTFVYTIFATENEEMGARYATIQIKNSAAETIESFILAQGPQPIISFQDFTAKQICVANWDTNGDGEMSLLEAKRVKSIGTVFKESSIKYFNEFRFFTGVSEVGYLSFMGSSIKEITFPSSITSIGNEAFLHCHTLTTAIINDTVSTIGTCAFDDCPSLKYISLPKELKILGNATFRGTALQSIDIPSSIEEIGFGVFSKCINLREITGAYASPDHRCLVKDGALYAFACKGISDYSFSTDIKRVAASTFVGLSTISKLSFASSTTEFGDYAFEDCSSLSSITFEGQGANITSLGVLLFQQCVSLSSIDISKATGLTRIPQRFLYGCRGITEFIIPESIEEIEAQAFLYCSSLKSIFCLPKTPPLLLSVYGGETDVFNYTNSGLLIFVPSSSYSDYYDAYTWISVRSKLRSI